MQRTCAVHEFPIPDREYRAAPSSHWDHPRRRPAPSRTKRRKRLLPLFLAGLALFAWGFLLGRAGAVENEPGPPEPFPSPFVVQPEEPEAKGSVPVQILPPDSADSGIQEKTGSSEAVNKDSWNLILVNAENPLPESFQVPELTQLRNGMAVDRRAYPDLQRMMDDCRAEGLEPLICSSYRSYSKQAELFEKKVASCLPQAGSRQEAEKQAALWVSRPGTSEHQTGLALDIVDKSYQLLDEGQENTAVQKWLMSHCAEYGFILRYPTDQSAITGVGYEPWHYRYVGVEAASEIMRQGICLEEYLNSRS